MRIRQRASASQKHKLSSTMMGWLPILHSSLEDLEKAVEPFVQNNSAIEIRSNFEKSLDKKFYKATRVQNSRTEVIESMSISKKTFYDVMREQIVPPLFPTDISQKIANVIIEYINCEGYFEADFKDIQKEYDYSIEEIEKVRKRFSFIDPVGVGAVDFKESFAYQLDDVENVDLAVYTLCKEMISNFHEIEIFSKEKYFHDALHVIKSFRNPPAIDFLEDIMCVIPEIFIDDEEGNLEVKINDKYYPEIKVNIENNIDDEAVQQSLKEAKNIIDALNMRKATLYKIGLMIVEFQYDYFKGGAIRPMRLKDLAGEIDRSQSTISRAISNKYLSCNRGVIAIKDFFSTALDEDTSNTAIKEFIQKCIKVENHKKPLSDNKLLELVEEEFGVTMVRRTMAKYRKQLNIAGSSERKKLYLFQV